MYNNYPYLILITILIIKTSTTQSKKEIMLLEGNQLDNQINLSNKQNTKLFLIFYVPHCLYCSHALKVLKEKIINKFEEEDNISFGVIDLENQNNVWIGLRFNITKIPYIILINKGKMHYYQNSFEENLVMKFLTEEKNGEDALDIPPPSTFFDKLKAVNKELTERIELFFEKLGLEKKFADKITYFVIILGFLIFIYIESKIISFCSNICAKKKNNISKSHKNNDDNINTNKIREKQKNE